MTGSGPYLVIPAVFKLESGLLEIKTISPIKAFGDDRKGDLLLSFPQCLSGNLVLKRLEKEQLALGVRFDKS